MKESIKPGDLVVADQFIDHTYQRPVDFFGDGIVAHVSLADPVCARSAPATSSKAGRTAGATVHDGGTYLCIEGPQFSTPRRVEALSQLGRRRYQHDRDAGGAPRERGRALLRDAGAGDRLRLLASVGEGGRYRRDPRGDARQRGDSRSARSKNLAMAVGSAIAHLRLWQLAQGRDHYRSLGDSAGGASRICARLSANIFSTENNRIAWESW